ncbi:MULTISPECIES: peroxide stress protein YaaA [unclassified Oleiphilus]|uniref:peroxide stress protein YaaA n=1 Tax=unclassified Oleiphilus TaxID=2631174 RepID=UPI0007C3B5F7|nr:MULTISPECIES: peroxide stress protein YaaA [unclassified Oleiphilus]KZZ35833.1 hypothetical protein A3756_14580 [Oleiphilus sp. HI0086]KZZ37785.1 hypothetical protein A3757_09875 [Oleiphilus sp. HI0117]KZZ53888.1 hypothetical protein A3761_15730 [Oleiphilus sp. HI0123]
MIIVVSPAKTLDFESASFSDEFSVPDFLDESKHLVDALKKVDSAALMKLMSVSEKIADLNVQRMKDWTVPFTAQNAKQAVYAFKGDVYTGLAVESMDSASVEYLQGKLRILSGLYGILRPLDLMQPYRLEMGTRLENTRGKNLYEFWGEMLTESLNRELEGSDEVLVNLASSEYFKSIKPKSLKAKVITPIFKDEKKGTYKIISFYAKKARGLMVRYAADNNIQSVEDLKGFDYAGYQYSESESSGTDWVFTRSESVAEAQK